MLGYWLGRPADDGHVKLADGPHYAPEGVAQAGKLYARIFSDLGPWVMVQVHAMPDVDVPINEEAARDCADLLAGRPLDTK